MTVRQGPVCRLLAPATYIFFASVIPALAFGQQLYIATGDCPLAIAHGPLHKCTLTNVRF